MMPALPLFVVFEGIDGSGKSTLAAMLENFCRAEGIPAYRGMEPTDGAWGKKIRAVLRGEIKADAAEQVELFIRDREDDVARNIAPALADGKMVILDRYYYSNAAYQGAMGIAADTIIAMNRARNFPEPQRVYLIDIDPAAALERIGARNGGGARDIFEKRQTLEAIRNNYLAMREGHFLVLDGTRAPEALLDTIISDIRNNFLDR